MSNEPEHQRRDDKWISPRNVLGIAMLVIGFFLSETMYRMDGVLKDHEKKHEEEQKAIAELKTQTDEREKNHIKRDEENREEMRLIAQRLEISNGGIAKDLKDSTASIARDLRESTEATTKRYESLIQKLGDKVDQVIIRQGAK